MTSGGGRKHRAVGAIAAGDLLPTGAAVDAAKRHGALAVAMLAADLAWPDLAAARACIDFVPYVSLAALIVTCPDVRPERLARCVGLDPLDGPDELARRMAEPGWPAEAVDVAVAGVLAGVEASR